ncbi:hypothetical protein GE21DRAFT_1219416, partial [Neurospora crassa]
RNVARAAPRGMHPMARSVSGAKTAADSRLDRAPNQRARLAYTPGKHSGR